MGTITPTSKNTYSLDGVSVELDDEWKAYALNSENRLRWWIVMVQYAKGGTLPTAFVNAFKEKYPDIIWPTVATIAGDHGAADRPRTGHVEGAVLPAEPGEDDITKGGEITFKWATTSWKKETDKYNKRKADGTLQPLEVYSNQIIEGDVVINLDGDIPDVYLSKDILDIWDELNQINGRVYYDAERIALGDLPESEYFLIPTAMEIPVCPIKDIGASLSSYDPGIPAIVGVYALAKAQGLQMKLNEDSAVKWAALRTEAFKVGWFNFQRFTAYKPVPPNPMKTFVDDGKKGMQIFRDAQTLCAFLPFLAEFYFRAYNGSYTHSNSADYIAKAQKIAAAASLSHHLNYLTQDHLFGKALAWVGVLRPMLVLKDAEASKRVPHPFILRKTAAPAGQAIITTSATIIEALQACHWWQGIAETGDYNGDILMAVSKEIKADPWKYHLMASVYEQAPLTADESRRVQEAREKADMFSPILQAYIDTVGDKSEISKAKSLKKSADNNGGLYTSAKALFQSVKRHKSTNVAELFKNDYFRVKQTTALEATNADVA